MGTALQGWAGFDPTPRLCPGGVFTLRGRFGCRVCCCMIGVLGLGGWLGRLGGCGRLSRGRLVLRLGRIASIGLRWL